MSMTAKYTFLSCILLWSNLCWSLLANEHRSSIESSAGVEEESQADEASHDGVSFVQLSGSRVTRKSFEVAEQKEQEHEEPQGFLERFAHHLWHAFQIDHRNDSKGTDKSAAIKEAKTPEEKHAELAKLLESAARAKTPEEKRTELAKLMEEAARKSMIQNGTKPEEKAAEKDAKQAEEMSKKVKSQEVLRKEIERLKRELEQTQQPSHSEKAKKVEEAPKEAENIEKEATKEADDALQQALEAHRLEDMNATESKPETVRDAPNEESELSDEFRRLSKDGVQKLEAKKYAYTLAVETLTEVEQAQCIGCHNRPNECYFACDEKPGYCSACDSFRGTRGACCGQTNGTRNGDDPSECQSVDIAQFKFSGYHQCVLTSKQAIYRVTDSDSEKVDRMSVFTPRKTGQASDIKFNYDEEPLCEDCVGRPNECWTTCGEKPGYCSACDSLWGTRGACCGINNGTRNGDDPPECHVDTDHFKYDAYHQCVLTSSKAGRQAQWKTNRTITFITVYDPYFETNLGQSALWLHRHELPHQWMLINNSKKIPISKLYARAQAKVANDLQIFVHPDVFLPNNFYDMFVYKLKLIEDIDPNWGVLGTAGIAGSIRGPLVSSITDPTTGTWRSGIDSKEITALDEQLLVLRRGSPQFDPDLPGFDLYGMDIVMQAKSLGQHSYLLNVQENHKLMAPDGNKYRANDFWDKIYSSEYEARVNKTAEYFEKKWCRSGNLPITGTTFYVDCEGWKWAR